MRTRRMAKLAATGGVWARGRPVAAGYSVQDSSCPLRGMPDSTRHRSDFCVHPEVAEARSKVAPKWAIALADNPMWVNGIFENPVGQMPILAVEGGIECFDRRGNRAHDVDALDIKGKVATDGGADLKFCPADCSRAVA